MTWGDIFNRHKSRGCDPSDAAYRADQWEARSDKEGAKAVERMVAIREAFKGPMPKNEETVVQPKERSDVNADD